MKKILLYLSLTIALAITAFLVYRFIYTLNTGPSEEQLQEHKSHDDEVVAPSKLDALEASFAEEDSTASDSLK
ncbi:MAG TPA: hypothetical protein DEP18_01170 [Flavobacteriales bacterium]|nr:hypothetical protein [Flavobacteriales bacterium]HCA82367.1 hypothetical protein [Flavobacteriales bacterium]HRE73592.1 hypothetical protein [Flavobacteriales bacterium]HRE95353.1 hypothetical protein [Flavobacteriales bacterium]HRJ35132.1 hypothetical protein [Flavobacteriales bacterium]